MGRHYFEGEVAAIYQVLSFEMCTSPERRKEKYVIFKDIE
jgi:hypothetical protein